MYDIYFVYGVDYVSIEPMESVAKGVPFVKNFDIMS